MAFPLIYHEARKDTNRKLFAIIYKHLLGCRFAAHLIQPFQSDLMFRQTIGQVDHPLHQTQFHSSPLEPVAVTPAYAPPHHYAAETAQSLRFVNSATIASGTKDGAGRNTS
jgi:hypothetical protein